MFARYKLGNAYLNDILRYKRHNEKLVIVACSASSCTIIYDTCLNQITGSFYDLHLSTGFSSIGSKFCMIEKDFNILVVNLYSVIKYAAPYMEAVTFHQ